MTQPFTPEIVSAVVRHMNGDHAADSVLIVRAFGGRPDADSALMTGMDSAGADFIVRSPTTGESLVEARVPWSQPLTDRASVRPEIVRLYTAACRKLGITPRPSAEH